MKTKMLRRQLVRTAASMYRSSGRFAYHFAKGKLAKDPVFTRILLRELIPSRARILDLGCGQGLLAAWLLAAQECRQSSAWCSNWPEPPRDWIFHGIELAPRDVDRARRALRSHAHIELGDIRSANFLEADVVVMLDVLHYMDTASQEAVLERATAALSRTGSLILRIGDAGAGLPFRISNWIDHMALLLRGHGWVRLNCRSVRGWTDVLKRLGLETIAISMSEKAPFANVLLVARAA
jgi:predicted TPR repeat methyltransferase